MKLPGITCYCDGHCPPPAAHENGTCQAKPGGHCFAAVEEVLDARTGQIFHEESFGCLPPEERGLMQCRGDLVPHYRAKTIECCATDMCNRHLRPRLADESTTPPPIVTTPLDGSKLPLLCLGLFGLIVLLVAALFLIRRRKRDKCVKTPLDKEPVVHREQSSGSGSGLPLLVRTTIGKQIRMVRPIGKGRHGEVWLGEWRDERVAVKIFTTTDEDSWTRETEIYRTVLMRHENVLGFVAADVRGSGSWTQMLLITDYHENGSLRDFLRSRTLDARSLRRMALSLASGLAHLHTEVFGTRGKPAIAHRDLSSGNVLVKRDGEVCIADFALAARHAADRGEVDVAPPGRRGSPRYAAPELLDGTFDSSDFEAYKAADSYALGLVFWEMCRRCVTGEGALVVDEYAAPYADCLPSEPSEEDARQAVCAKKIRPQVSPRWERSDLLVALTKIMRECWHANPAVRPSALRIKKTLAKLAPAEQNQML